MEYLRQTIASDKLNGIFNLPPALRDKKVEVIILPAEEEENVSEKPNYALKLGFVDVPPLPDSFFDPLPEEDLQAWGL